jgi:uncharacterized phage protein (TIGR01671 family)
MTMREILFRGQTRRKGQKVWMDGTPVDSNWVEGYGVCMGKGDFSVIYAGDHVEKFVVYTDTVGQYTGLTDKNDKKIFEGDIVRGNDNLEMDLEVSGYIDHQNGSFVIVGDFMTHYRWLDYEVEVIGNIHDNPELLEGE